MKILLVIPKYRNIYEKDYDYDFPLGLSYISAVLKKAKYNVNCINLNHHDGTISEIILRILNENHYDIVCTGNNALGYAVTQSIIDSVKNHKSKPKIILGGPIITTSPKLIFNDLKPDYGVLGEGEETIVELIDYINDNKDLKQVKGIIYEDNREIVLTEKRKSIEDLDSIPFPDFEGFELGKQLDNIHCNFNTYSTITDFPRIYPLLASRSCPFQCTFCYHEGKYRKRSIKNIMKELDTAVRKYDINWIMIYDDCFAFDKERMSDFCHQIKKLSKETNKEIKWACQLMVSVVNSENLKLLKDAGCVVISYGFESYSKTVLRSMRKSITPEQINFAFHETLKNKISVQANFIFGDVAETNETVNETITWWENNAKGQIYMDFIQPYPGSRIYEHCLNKGLIKNELDFIKNKIGPAKEILNMTDAMSNKEIQNLKYRKMKLYGKYHKFVRPIIIKTPIKNVYTVKTKCPFCKETSEYNNCVITNKWTFGFDILCRRCFMKFVVVSPIQKFARKNYFRISPLVKLYFKITDLYKKYTISSKK